MSGLNGMWQELLAKNAAVAERVQFVRDEEDALRVQLGQADFTTPEGIQKALKLQGQILGLARAHDILTEQKDD